MSISKKKANFSFIVLFIIILIINCQYIVFCNLIRITLSTIAFWDNTLISPKKSPPILIDMNDSKLLPIIELPQDGARSFVTFDGKLYIGIANLIDLNTFLKSTCCEVWRIGNIDRLNYT